VRKIEFYASEDGPWCAVTFYNNGTCTLHHQEPFDMKWVVLDGMVYQVWPDNGKMAKHCKYIQDAYETHIRSLIESHLTEEE
jgi:hypothetical protein